MNLKSTYCAKKFTHVIYVKMILLAGVAILGTRVFFSRATGSFVSSAAGRQVFGQRPKTREKNRFSRESL